MFVRGAANIKIASLAREERLKYLDIWPSNPKRTNDWRCKCTDDGSRSYRNVCKMSIASFRLVVVCIMRLAFGFFFLLKFVCFTQQLMIPHLLLWVRRQCTTVPPPQVASVIPSLVIAALQPVATVELMLQWKRMPSRHNSKTVTSDEQSRVARSNIFCLLGQQCAPQKRTSCSDAFTWKCEEMCLLAGRMGSSISNSEGSLKVEVV